MTLNKQQRRIIKRWPKLLKEFAFHEWRTVAVGYASGACLVSVITFIKFSESSHYRSILRSVRFDTSLALVTGHLPILLLGLSPLAVIILVKISDIALRAMRSWLLGVASGSYFWPFVITTVGFWNTATISLARVAISLVVTAAVLLISFGLRLWAALSRQAIPLSNQVKFDSNPIASYYVRDPDAPIESWNEDRLSRSALVEILVHRILGSTTPVIALRGRFGDGKSSLLNLLRAHLEKSAIVVTFSTWLPDSQATLIADLFADIAIECRRHFLVPGLRKHLRKFAALLGAASPYLKALPEIVPVETQRREISDLGDLLGRLPKRLVVLLDEIDRMQKDEILALLKMLRGASSLPNITFVCALHQEQVEKVVCGAYDADSHEFFEKFFPVALDLPKPSVEILKTTFRDQIIQHLEAIEWVREEGGDKEFNERLDQLWDDALVKLLTNIRKVGLLTNDFHVASIFVINEADPLDLAAIEAVRRFYPLIHELIWTNAAFFVKSNSWWKSRSYLSEKDMAQQKQTIVAEIEKIVAEPERQTIYDLLGQMFPERVRELSNRSYMGRATPSLEEAEKARRIAHPDYFPIYFRKAVPESIFSAVEMERFKDGLIAASSDGQRKVLYWMTLEALEKDSLRRYDFVHKLALALETLPLDIAESIAHAIVETTDKLTRDFFFGEGLRALAGVLAVAQRLSSSDRINGFVTECIKRSKSDLFAARLYKLMTKERAKNKVITDFKQVRDSDLQQAFAQRMDSRYGVTADLSNLNQAELDTNAFSLWAEISSVEREKEVKFWERYIGDSRRKLAQVFGAIVPATIWWAEGSYEFVDSVIPKSTLERLYRDLPLIETLDPEQNSALERLGKFLNGELKEGTILEVDDEITAADP